MKIVGIVGGIITLAFLIYIGGYFLGTLEKSTIAGCSLDYLSEVNNTLLDAGTTRCHGFLLSYYISSQNERDSTLEVFYNYGDASCSVSVDGEEIGTLDGTSPDSFTLSKNYMPQYNICYKNCGSTNITKSNITYYGLANCDYTESQYNALQTTKTLGLTSFSLLSVIILLFVSLAIITSLILLVKK